MLLFFYNCNNKPKGIITSIEREPLIEPDYSGVTVPPNIAPLNFLIREQGSVFTVKITSESGTKIEIYSHNGKIQIPQNKWKELLESNKGSEFSTQIFLKNENNEWFKFKTLKTFIALEPVDTYLYYRLLYPGYESWNDLSINRRNLENFNTSQIIENGVVDKNCINCHAFNNGKTDDFLFHIRGTMGGTIIHSGGRFKKVNLKTDEMKNNATYPRWHPSGKFVAFSTNLVKQRFHSADNKKVEVGDLESSLVLYDIEKQEIMKIRSDDSSKFMDTYPEWSPDGLFLYFCRTEQVKETSDYRQIRYDLYRIAFDPLKRTIIGKAEMVFDAVAAGTSISFPRISPDGRFLVVTTADYGCFPIWHKEADLYSIDMVSFKFTRLDLNSDFTESYHSWSSNGKWLVFSSKRGDGLTARPYISYINENGLAAKPFILPQKDPEFYVNILKSYNIPEFSNLEVHLKPGEIRRLWNSVANRTRWSEN